MCSLAWEGHWKFCLASWNEYLHSAAEKTVVQMKKKGGYGVAAGCSRCFHFLSELEIIVLQKQGPSGTCETFGISAIVHLLS